MIALHQEPINHPSFSVFLRFDIGLFPQARKGDITQLKLTKGKELKKNKTKNIRWIAQEPERWDRTSACKGALLKLLQSMFWSHLAHPDQWRLKSDRPWHQGQRPLPFRTMSRVLLRPLPTEVQGWRQGQRLNVTAQWRDHLHWERDFTASMISPRLRVVPHFSSGIVERAKHERAWKSPHARKSDTGRSLYRYTKKV